MKSSLSLSSPAWFIILCILLGVVYAYVLYRKEKTDLFEEQPVFKWILPAVRAVLIAFIAFLLLGPFVNRTAFTSVKPLVLIGADNSLSVADSKDRMTQVLNDLQAKLSDKFEVQLLSVGEGTNVVDDSMKFNGEFTDLAGFISKASTDYADRNLAAAVLLTDGIYNRGANPSYSIRKFAKPLYTIGFGDSTPQRDASIDQVLYNSVVYLGNEYPVQIDVKANKLKGKSAVITLRQNGVKVWNKTLNYSKDVDVLELPLDLTAKKTGVDRITVDLQLLEEEENKSNNSYSFYVDVIESRKKVELWAKTIHPDIGAFKQLISMNDNYQFKLKRKNAEMLSADQDLVILYDWFGSESELRQFEELKSKGIPTLIAIGERFNPRWFNQGSQEVHFNSLGRGVNQALPMYNSTFEYFEMEQEARDVVASWPPLTSPFGRFKGYKQGDVVLYQKIGQVETSDPLLLLRMEKNYRYGVLGGIGIWQWRLRDHEQNGEHRISSDLVTQWLQFLTVKDRKKLLNIDPASKVFPSNKAVVLHGELYNQSLEAVEGAEIELSIMDENGKELKRVMGSKGTKYQLSLQNLEAGSYTYEGKTSLGGELLKDQGYFSVTDNKVEYMDLTARFDLLRFLSAQTAGQFATAEDWSQLSDRLLNDKDLTTVVKEDQNWIEWIEFKWLFWLILTLLSFEWFIRKFIGGY